MLLTVFRSRLRPGIDTAALEQLGTRMHEIATAMPGFVSYRSFASADGEELTLVEFADEPSLAAWRNHPEHVAAQQLGREKFFSEYCIQVCLPLRESRFEAT